MSPFTEVTLEQIKELSPTQLTKVLHRLLFLEAAKYGLVDWERHVPFDINTADDGSDGLMRWKNGPKRIGKLLVNRYTVYQCKATKSLIPSKLYWEIVTRSTKAKVQLKKEVAKLIAKDGCYVLFTTQSMSVRMISERVLALRRALKDAEVSNWNNIQIEIFDADKIKDLVNTHIAAVVEVNSFTGVSHDLGWLTIERSLLTQLHSKSGFQSNDYLKSKSDNFLKVLPINKVVRIFGQSGVGKSRFVLETLSKSDLGKSCIYYDLKGDGDLREVKRFINNAMTNKSGVLILDSCSIEQHEIIKAAVPIDSSMNIVTIGIKISEVEEQDIEIHEFLIRDVVNSIILNVLNLDRDNSLSRHIAKYAEGFPWLGIRFAEAMSEQDATAIDPRNITKFAQPLLFGLDDVNQNEYDVISCLALFTSFRILNDAYLGVQPKELEVLTQSQYDYIRQELLDSTISKLEFNKIIKKYIAKGVLKARGTKAMVKPNILAIHLAADWIDNSDISSIEKMIQDLRVLDLKTEFFQRLKELRHLDKTKHIFSRLLGADATLSSLEALNTVSGSELLYAASLVDQEGSLRALENKLSDQSTNDLKKFDLGRRNIVVTLSKLCFDKRYFFRAGTLLFRLGLAENKDYSNNASGHFEQLFQLYLPGTESPYPDRIKLLKWCVANMDGTTDLILKAVRNALKLRGFYRGGESEIRGLRRPFVDYRPSSHEEIHEYLQSIFSILEGIAESREYLPAVKKVVEDAILPFIHEKAFNLIGGILFNLASASDNVWPEARGQLRLGLNTAKRNIDKDKETIQSLVSQLAPKDIEQKLIQLVSTPPHSVGEMGADHHRIDTAKNEAIQLAEELYNSMTEWEQYLPGLLIHEQRRTYFFAYRLAELRPKDEGLVNRCISILNNTDETTRNYAFLGGYLSGCKDILFFRKIRKMMIEQEVLLDSLVYLSRFCDVVMDDIWALFPILEIDSKVIKRFETIQYFECVSKLDATELIKTCNRFTELGNEGQFIAIGILQHHLSFNLVQWDEIDKAAVDILAINNPMLHYSRSDGLFGHSWSEMIGRILDSSNAANFASELARQISEYCEQRDYTYMLNQYLTKAGRRILNDHFDIVWPVFSTTLLKEYHPASLMLEVLGSKGTWVGQAENYRFNFEDHQDVIFDWCVENPTIAPLRIAREMPLTENNNSGLTWHPFSKKIIDTFGAEVDILSAISANLGTYGLSGSRVPYIETQIALMKELVDHEIDVVAAWAQRNVTFKMEDLHREKLEEADGYM